MNRDADGEQEEPPSAQDGARGVRVEETDNNIANADAAREAVHDKADRVAGETFEPVGASTGEIGRAHV